MAAMAAAHGLLRTMGRPAWAVGAAAAASAAAAAAAALEDREQRRPPAGAPAWWRAANWPRPRGAAAPASCAAAAAASGPRVCVCGDVFVDVMAKVQGLPTWDADVEADFVKVLPGGSALNQARTMQGLGLDVRFIGALGDDSFGEMLRRHVEGQGFSMQYMKIFKSLPSSVCLVLTGPHDRAFVSCYSTTDAFSTRDLVEREAALEGCCHFHIGGYFNLKGLMNCELTALLKRQRAKGLTVSINTQFDASGAWTGTNGHLRQLLLVADLLFVNETEAQSIATAMFGKTALPDSLCEAYPNLTVIMTKGKDGVDILRHKKKTITVPTTPLKEVVDATGAGDAFIAGFLSSWLTRPCPYGPDGLEKHLAASAARGNAAARICVGREGACVEPVRTCDLGPL